jgi:hypothetical protein
MLNKPGIKLIPIVIMLAVLIMGSCKTASKSDRDKDGFVKIFDGKTLKGWEGDPTYWKVENGSLVGQVTPSTLLKTNTFIIWNGGQTADFELKVEYRIAEGGNSGINYRSARIDSIPYAMRGYQADIDGRNRYTGQNYEERGRTTLAYRGEKVMVNQHGSSAAILRDHIKNNAWTERTVESTVITADALGALIKSNDWNEIHIIAKGNRLKHFINGSLVSDVTDNDDINRKMTGQLGVQVHVGPPMTVEYRNIRLKQL